MDRMRRVRQLWDWLPAFRAVAETEHLTRAASALHLSPPALSRTLKLLEDDLGRPLFDREGRGLVLNAAGDRLLVAVRAAMRLVHDALEEVEAEDAPLRVASTGIFTAVGLTDTLIRLAETHPHVRPEVVTSLSADPGADLTHGRIDLLFTSSPPTDDALIREPLCRSGIAVYCGPTHPLANTAAIDAEALLGHAFVAPPGDPPPDGWPVAWPRAVRVVADRQAVGLALCRSGRYLGVFPEVVRAAHPELRRLPIEIPGEARIWAVYRSPVETPGPAAAAAQHARAALSGRPFIPEN